MRDLGLISIILSIAALIGLAYTQNLYHEALRKINALEKKASVSKNGVGNSLQASKTTNNLPEQSSISQRVLSPVGSSPSQHGSIQSQQNIQKLLPVTQETEKFYTMFKDAMKHYNKEMIEKDTGEWKQKYIQSRLKRYKKKLNANDIQWGFLEPILTEYLQKNDELWQSSLDPEGNFLEEEFTDHWQNTEEKQKALKEEYVKKLSPYLTNQQLDGFKKMDSFGSGGIFYTVGSQDN